MADRRCVAASLRRRHFGWPSMSNVFRGLFNPGARIRTCRMQRFSDWCDGRYMRRSLVDARAVGRVPPQTGIDANYPQMVTPSFRYDLECIVIAFVSQQHPLLLLYLDDDEGASASDVAVPHSPHSSSRSTQAQR